MGNATTRVSRFCDGLYHLAMEKPVKIYRNWDPYQATIVNESKTIVQARRFKGWILCPLFQIPGDIEYLQYQWNGGSIAFEYPSSFGWLSPCLDKETNRIKLVGLPSEKEKEQWTSRGIGFLVDGLLGGFAPFSSTENYELMSQMCAVMETYGKFDRANPSRSWWQWYSDKVLGRR